MGNPQWFSTRKKHNNCISFLATWMPYPAQNLKIVHSNWLSSRNIFCKSLNLSRKFMVKSGKSISKKNGLWQNIFCKWLIEIKALCFIFLVDKIKIFYRKSFKVNFMCCPQLMIETAVCRIPQIIVTVSCFESRQKFCCLASIVLNSCPSLLWGWICFCVVILTFQDTKTILLEVLQCDIHIEQ